MKLNDAISTFQRNAKARSDKRLVKKLRHSDMGRKLSPGELEIAWLQVALGQNDGAGRREIHGKTHE